MVIPLEGKFVFVEGEVPNWASHPTRVDFKTQSARTPKYVHYASGAFLRLFRYLSRTNLRVTKPRAVIKGTGG